MIMAVSSACLMTSPSSTLLRSPLVRRRRSPVLKLAMLNSHSTTVRQGNCLTNNLFFLLEHL